MAKYCMFCGEELPDKAQFCPSCGQKQASVAKQETPSSNKANYNFEDEDDEMDLLLKYGMMTNPSKPKSEPQKVITLDYKPEIEEIKEESTPTVSKPIIKETDYIIGEYDFLGLSNNNKPIEEPQIQTKSEPEIKKEPEPTIIVQPEPIIEKTEQLPDIQPELEISPEEDFDFVEEEPYEETNTYNDWEDDFDYVEPDEELIVKSEETEEELETVEEEQQKPQEPQAVNRHAAKRRDMAIRRRSVSIEEEEETFSTTLNNDNKNSMFNAVNMHADEKADYEKRKNAKIEEDIDAKLDDRSELEGRKQQTQKIEKRRKSQRTYDESKHYKIEHDKSEIDKNDDPEYDGYYENVLPIDHDQERKKSFDPKTLLIILGMVVGCVVLVYVLMQVLF